MDTNVLVRYVVQDDPTQAEAATRLIEEGCSMEQPAYIGAVVYAGRCASTSPPTN